MSINYEMLMDDCGGHAGYHLHEDPACEYDNAASTTHSPAVAVALDGHVVSFPSIGMRSCFKEGLVI